MRRGSRGGGERRESPGGEGLLDVGLGGVGEESGGGGEWGDGWVFEGEAEGMGGGADGGAGEVGWIFGEVFGGGGGGVWVV